MVEVTLQLGARGAKRVSLREPSGREEALPPRSSPVFASELVGRLLEDSVDVWSLSIANRDRLIAELYLACYGDRVDAIATCRDCERGFSIGFSLSALLDEQVPRSPEGVVGPDAEGAYRLPNGCRFRLPTAGDERAVAALPDPATELLARCVLEGDAVVERSAIEAALEQIAPVLALELPASCPHCGGEQGVHFDATGFFLASFERERPLLWREVYCLANAFHWSHAEIVALSRSERRAYVELVLAQRYPDAEGLLS